MQRQEAGAGRRTGEVVQTVDHATDAELVLDRYRLVRRLGAGGMGVVWLAEDQHLQRMVAVKRIAMHDAAVAARAEREARAAARLGHPGVVALYESGRDEDSVYLVSELVRGRTLADLMAAGELSDRDVVGIGVALCDALAHAHGRGVIHRDVKPGNIIVPDEPVDGASIAKLTDFGIARMLGDDALTATGDVVGTLAYMAPEQAEGREVGEAADLYALALVLYEALSGVNPVRGRGAAATARRVGARLPTLSRLRRDLPPELCRALDQAVLPRPEQRGTVAALRATLAAELGHTDDARGTIAPSRLEGLTRTTSPRTPLGVPGRVLAAVAAAGLAALGTTLLDGIAIAPAAGAAGVAVLLLPRLGWLATAAALAALGGGDVAVVVLAAALPTIVLLRRAGVLWSLPAGAPLLGMASLASAWPVLAAQADRPWHRAALGALGCWWLLLVEMLIDEKLVFGAPLVADHEVWPLITSGAVALAAVWAVAAVVLPVVVRGRSFHFDLVAAITWAAALAAASRAVADTLSGQPSVRGLVLGAVVGAALAVGIAASRGDAYARSPS